MKTQLVVVALVLVFGLVPFPVMAEPEALKFADWLQELRDEAKAAGISEATLDLALANLVTPRAEVVTLDRSQPELTQAFSRYLAARVGEERIDRGQLMLRRYPTWLGRVERDYGVQRRFIVALWGMESSYGLHTGNFPVVEALAALAYDGRRAAYFRGELLNALRIVDAGYIPFERMKGSWAGAMGQCQFMPSSFLRFAVDADGDGRRDIWESVPDVLASTANYLAHHGWQDDQTWGRPVRLPREFDAELAGLETRLPLSRWQALGVRRLDGRPLPRRELKASLLLPDGPQGPAFLVYDNFRALLRWNRSISFALAVGSLSDLLENRR